METDPDTGALINVNAGRTTGAGAIDGRIMIAVKPGDYIATATTDNIAARTSATDEHAIYRGITGATVTDACDMCGFGRSTATVEGGPNGPPSYFSSTMSLSSDISSIA